MRNSAPVGAAAVEAEHQAGVVVGAAADVAPQAERAVVAVDVPAPPLGEAEGRVPGQRAVGEDPEVVARRMVAKERPPHGMALGLCAHGGDAGVDRHALVSAVEKPVPSDAHDTCAMSTRCRTGTGRLRRSLGQPSSRRRCEVGLTRNSRHPDAPLAPFLPHRRFPRPMPERVFIVDHQSSPSGLTLSARPMFVVDAVDGSPPTASQCANTR